MFDKIKYVFMTNYFIEYGVFFFSVLMGIPSMVLNSRGMYICNLQLHIDK
jgi:hypothetical protein